MWNEHDIVNNIDFIHVYVSEVRIFANRLFTAYSLDGSN